MGGVAHLAGGNRLWALNVIRGQVAGSPLANSLAKYNRSLSF